MKNNKRYVLIFLLLLMTAVTTVQAQTEVSIKAGAHYSKVILEDETGNGQEAQFTPGWNIGLSVEVPMVNKFYIQRGRLYTRKGLPQKKSGFAGSVKKFKVKGNY